MDGQDVWWVWFGLLWCGSDFEFYNHLPVGSNRRSSNSLQIQVLMMLRSKCWKIVFFSYHVLRFPYFPPGLSSPTCNFLHPFHKAAQSNRKDDGRQETWPGAGLRQTLRALRAKNLFCLDWKEVNTPKDEHYFTCYILPTFSKCICVKLMIRKTPAKYHSAFYDPTLTMLISCSLGLSVLSPSHLSPQIIGSFFPKANVLCSYKWTEFNRPNVYPSFKIPQ